VSQRTGIINQIRAFLLERGIAVRQGQRFLRAELPRILAAPLWRPWQGSLTGGQEHGRTIPLPEVAGSV